MARTIPREDALQAFDENDSDLVVIGVPVVSPVIRRSVFEQSGYAEPAVEVLCMIAAGILIYVTIAFAGWAAAKTMHWLAPTVGWADKLGGATLGGIKAVAVVYLLAVLVVMVEDPLAEWDPDDRLGIEDSRVAGFAAEHNVLAPWQFPDLSRLHRALDVGALLAETGEYELVRQREDAASFLGEERVETLVGDEQLVEWARQDAYPLTLADPRVRELLSDEEMVELLKRANWRELQNQLSEKSDVSPSEDDGEQN